ncbi:MAG: hypothetical protein Kow0068_06540 [Marinilabiliales bacterium]
MISCTYEQEQEKGTQLRNVLRINEASFYNTLYPPAAKDIASIHIIGQIYEGLVKYNPEDLSVEPAIAEKWEVSPDGKIYTFHLRDNVFFHDDSCFTDGKGRQVTASDFKYTYELLCTKDEYNTSFYGILDKVVGAKDFYNDDSLKSDIDGIRVIDDFTLQIELTEEHPLLLYFLANPQAVVLPHEAINMYGKNSYIGCGPFYLDKKNKSKDKLRLIKFPKYYKTDNDGNKMPYLDTVLVTFVSSLQREIHMFENDELDVIIGIPGEKITEFMDKHVKEFESNPPVYVLNQSNEDIESNVYNIFRSYVKGLYTNRMNFLDLSRVYYEMPKEIEKEKLKEELLTNN